MIEIITEKGATRTVMKNVRRLSKEKLTTLLMDSAKISRTSGWRSSVLVWSKKTLQHSSTTMRATS